jgi:hypothetical protein
MHRSLLVFVIITLLLIPTLVISSVTYYKNVKIIASITQQPIVPERPPNASYISSFSVGPTGVNIDVSLDRSQITYVNNQGVAKITLMELKVLEEGRITFKLNTPRYVNVTMMIYSSDGSLIGVYPNNSAITLSPGNYLIIEEVRFPGIPSINSTDTSFRFEIGGNYVFIVNGVWLIYSINESIEIK